MKRTAWEYTALLVSLMLAAPAWAQEEQPEPAQPGGGPRPAHARSGTLFGRTSRSDDEGREVKRQEGIVNILLGDLEAAGKLGIDPQNISSLKEKWHALKREEGRLRGELEQAAIEQVKLMTAPQVTEEDLMSAVEKTGGIRTSLAKLNARKILLLKQNLTPEQIKKVKEMARAHIARGRSAETDGGHGRDGKPRGSDRRHDPAERAKGTDSGDAGQ